jgi:hypothetical protein
VTGVGMPLRERLVKMIFQLRDVHGTEIWLMQRSDLEKCLKDSCFVIRAQPATH